MGKFLLKSGSVLKPDGTNPQYKSHPGLIYPGEVLKIPGEGQRGQSGRIGLPR